MIARMEKKAKSGYWQVIQLLAHVLIPCGSQGGVNVSTTTSIDHQDSANVVRVYAIPIHLFSRLACDDKRKSDFHRLVAVDICERPHGLQTEYVYTINGESQRCKVDQIHDGCTHCIFFIPHVSQVIGDDIETIPCVFYASKSAPKLTLRSLFQQIPWISRWYRCVSSRGRWRVCRAGSIRRHRRVSGNWCVSRRRGWSISRRHRGGWCLCGNGGLGWHRYRGIGWDWGNGGCV